MGAVLQSFRVPRAEGAQLVDHPSIVRHHTRIVDPLAQQQIDVVEQKAAAILERERARILTVTGILTALAMLPMTRAACAGSRIRLQPALCFAIFGTGQPMLTSTMSAPIPSTTCAAAAIFSGSPPKI